MSIKDGDLERVVQVLERLEVQDASPLTRLRERFPTIRIVRLGTADVEGRPVRSSRKFDLYLLDTQEHCPVLTDDLSRARTIVVAPRTESSN